MRRIAVTGIGVVTPTGIGAPAMWDSLVNSRSGISAIEHFIDCVVQDRQPMVTGEDGLIAARVVEAIEESARTRKPVEVQ